MNIHRKVVCWLLVAGWCAVPAVGFAGKCAGNNVNTMLSWEPSEIGKGTTLTTFRHTSVIVSDDQSAPFHLAAGECIGALLTTHDGKMHGSGSCARKDKDGDVLNEDWTLPAGSAFKGTSWNSGGTGKYATAAGTFTWEVVMSEGKMATVRWVGNCQ